MDFDRQQSRVVYSVNSLFPKKYALSGVGTAFVARSLLEASDIDDAVRRAADARVSTAMSYNLGSTHEKAV